LTYEFFLCIYIWFNLRSKLKETTSYMAGEVMIRFTLKRRQRCS